MTNHVAGVNIQVTAQDPIPEKPVEAVKPVVKPIETPKLDSNYSKCAGLDIGTMNIISSRQNGPNVEYKRIRDVFIDLTKDQVKMLKLSGETSYITKDDICYVLGDDAATIANIFGRQLRNPLTKGVISPGELEAMSVLSVMVGEVLGKSPEGGICVVSSPGDPVDSDFDVIFHQAVITDIVSNYGWNVTTASESTALAYAECADNDFSGLCLSFGAGMTNISLVFKTIEALKFSVSRGGNWIDSQTAKSCGKLPSQICAIKEKGLDLLNPVGREQSALVIFYKHLIGYAIYHFIQNFRKLQGNIEIPKEIPCIIAGGTSLPKNFINLVKNEINKNNGFPFPISEVKLASDPLNSISRGLLILSQNS